MIRAKRKECDPNLGYLCALADWVETCKAAEVRALPDRVLA